MIILVIPYLDLGIAISDDIIHLISCAEFKCDILSIDGGHTTELAFGDIWAMQVFVRLVSEGSNM